MLTKYHLVIYVRNTINKFIKTGTQVLQIKSFPLFLVVDVQYDVVF